MSFEYANWPLPDNVRAGWSDRIGGVSEGPFHGLNLGRHVADKPEHVALNRQHLAEQLLGRPSIAWLNQTHSTVVTEASQADSSKSQDASYSTDTKHACCVMTADCLPVFFWQHDGNKVAVAHAGWRGLADGILAETMAVFDQPEKVSCGIGPAISQANFQVGEDVIDAFSSWPEYRNFFRAQSQVGKYLADLPGLAKDQLLRLGASSVYLSELCSFDDATRFYSYRRDGVTGRMANLIWRVDESAG
ncbi:peptidoglycan editing factor PgeF [Reinekea thalattae]|uniref:Purine nucleoside phosphorylase n=1 Tax=Reinekea thalattae TaxID=2593301 RepID=A0A5C8Z2J8_9GAMM|nr:peptidoglycan editing factor PgeF [Reinekea thalattae]TXR51524.1 peptidoglycan editing factor PgeF [Reinekea thalattae]